MSDTECEDIETPPPMCPPSCYCLTYITRPLRFKVGCSRKNPWTNKPVQKQIRVRMFLNAMGLVLGILILFVLPLFLYSLLLNADYATSTDNIDETPFAIPNFYLCTPEDPEYYTAGNTSISKITYTQSSELTEFHSWPLLIPGFDVTEECLAIDKNLAKTAKSSYQVDMEDNLILEIWRIYITTTYTNTDTGILGKHLVTSLDLAPESELGLYTTDIVFIPLVGAVFVDFKKEAIYDQSGDPDIYFPADVGHLPIIGEDKCFDNGTCIAICELSIRLKTSFVLTVTTEKWWQHAAAILSQTLSWTGQIALFVFFFGFVSVTLLSCCCWNERLFGFNSAHKDIDLKHYQNQTAMTAFALGNAI
eukprot:TRINITY_DN2349_c0_g3_i1.p1 TRINITY_DN2349_c0_g3~~TRINITY_DN2349_c0_g3_i1.p1  ORF type:complete len:363 (+),score=39.63 TRINITY_DN2349_c0_g3_i1:167-1255(+)